MIKTKICLTVYNRESSKHTSTVVKLNLINVYFSIFINVDLTYYYFQKMVKDYPLAFFEGKLK